MPAAFRVLSTAAFYRSLKRLAKQLGVSRTSVIRLLRSWKRS
jgi:biotin operon repressor